MPKRGEPLICLEISGGYTGQISRLEISPDGAARLEVGGRMLTGQVDPEQVDGLVAGLRSVPVDGGSESGSGVPGAGGGSPAGGAPSGRGIGAADLRSYQLHVAGRTLITHDTSVPQDLSEPLHRLEEMMRSVQLAAAREGAQSSSRRGRRGPTPS